MHARGKYIITGGMVQKPGTILCKNGQNQRFYVFWGGIGQKISCPLNARLVQKWFLTRNPKQDGIRNLKQEGTFNFLLKNGGKRIN